MKDPRTVSAKTWDKLVCVCGHGKSQHTVVHPHICAMHSCNGCWQEIYPIADYACGCDEKTIKETCMNEYECLYHTKKKEPL